MATRDDLDETVNLVEKTGRRIVAEQGDVRDLERLKAAVANGVAELGRVDFVLANAGIMPAAGEQRYEMSAYIDAVDVLLNGVYYTRWRRRCPRCWSTARAGRSSSPARSPD
jgi:NAD(P)-dependent dehydrogenase (short-subunit alcohol dehydrogenase family)